MAITIWSAAGCRIAFSLHSILTGFERGEQLTCFGKNCFSVGGGERPTKDALGSELGAVLRVARDELHQRADVDALARLRGRSVQLLAEGDEEHFAHRLHLAGLRERRAGRSCCCRVACCFGRVRFVAAVERGARGELQRSDLRGLSMASSDGLGSLQHCRRLPCTRPIDLATGPLHGLRRGLRRRRRGLLWLVGSNALAFDLRDREPLAEETNLAHCEKMLHVLRRLTVTVLQLVANLREHRVRTCTGDALVHPQPL